MKTPICDLLGIEFPIVAFTHCRDVAAAVSKAGGLGVLGIGAYTPEKLQTELDWIEHEIGDRPYGVDVLIPAKSTNVSAASSPEELIPEGHRQFVNELLDNYDVPQLPTPATRPVLGGIKETAVSLVDLALERPIRLVANALGPPPPELVTAAHDRDVLVAALVGTRATRRSNGRRASTSSWPRATRPAGTRARSARWCSSPRSSTPSRPTPVLAAGGVGSGRQVAAALALGAAGRVDRLGLAHDRGGRDPSGSQGEVPARDASDTVRSRASTGKPTRQLRSAWTEAWDDPANPDPLPMPLQQLLTYEARERIHRSAAGSSPGARELITYFVGQVVGSMNQVNPARQVVFDMVDEYIEAVGTLCAAMDTDA